MWANFIMNIHEHQAKEILKEFGIPILNGVVIFDLKELNEKVKKLWFSFVYKGKFEIIMNFYKKVIFVFIVFLFFTAVLVKMIEPVLEKQVSNIFKEKKLSIKLKKI